MDIEDLIKKRAYEIYIRRTQSELWDWGRMGSQNGDWTQAEFEVRKEQKNGFKNNLVK